MNLRMIRSLHCNKQSLCGGYSRKFNSNFKATKVHGCMNSSRLGCRHQGFSRKLPDSSKISQADCVRYTTTNSSCHDCNNKKPSRKPDYGEVRAAKKYDNYFVVWIIFFILIFDIDIHIHSKSLKIAAKTV